MNQRGAYGSTLAEAFRLDRAPALVTRSLNKSRLAMTEVRCDREQFGMTKPIPREDAYLVAVQMGPCERHELWSDDRPAEVSPIVGGETMIYDLRRNPIARMDSAFHSVHFYLPKAVLDWIAEDVGAAPIGELDCIPGKRMDDPVVRGMAEVLSAALSQPEAVNTAFAEHALLTIAAHTASKYGHLSVTRRIPHGGLAAWQERRAKELLCANLTEGASLTDLARECGLSVSHFTRAFRQTTGLPPHRWLLQRRIERARELLRDRSRTLPEIALACGFADQSHFTRVFSSATGLAPGAWRRGIED
ncbi:AraC family transcriptional regulator [Rudaea sp.]|uniref:helix-turn-helix transcriptional regulator n=1 Tax=Rudaea sp. TaxID=2136325 RepID=UPI00321F6CDE